MSRKKLTMSNLIRNNKEELMRDREELEKIDKRIDDKHMQLRKESDMRKIG